MAVIDTFEAEPQGHDVDPDTLVAVLQDPLSTEEDKQRAFAEIDHEFRRPVLKLAHKLVHNHLDAEDVAQDTLFKAWEKIDSYEPGTFIGWLMRITYNRAMDFHRFRGRHPQSFDYDEINEDGFRALVDTSEKSAETQFEDNELSSEMAAKLKKISPDFALPIALRYIDDLDYEAIAQKLDVPIGTVRSRIHRGKIALKKLLEE